MLKWFVVVVLCSPTLEDFLASVAMDQEESLPERAVGAVFLLNGHVLQGGAPHSPTVLSLPLP